MAPVSGALCPGQDGLAGHPLAVRRQAKVAHEVDETRGQVQLAAKLAGGVVVRKGMVVVVEAFACKRPKQKKKKQPKVAMEAMRQSSRQNPEALCSHQGQKRQKTHTRVANRRLSGL